MQEELVTLETAILAKEKGFNERGHYFYKVKSENDIELYGCTRKQLVGFKGCVPIYHKVRDYHTNKKKSNAKLYRCSAPTQSLLSKWLREEHNIHLIAYKNINIDGYDWCYITTDGITNINSYKTYEEALEIGLQEALKQIPNI